MSQLSFKLLYVTSMGCLFQIFLIDIVRIEFLKYNQSFYPLPLYFQTLPLGKLLLKAFDLLHSDLTVASKRKKYNWACAS